MGSIVSPNASTRSHRRWWSCGSSTSWTSRARSNWRTASPYAYTRIARAAASCPYATALGEVVSVGRVSEVLSQFGRMLVLSAFKHPFQGSRRLLVPANPSRRTDLLVQGLAEERMREAIRDRAAPGGLLSDQTHAAGFFQSRNDLLLR